MVWIVLATEDEISECVGRQLAAEAGLEVGQALRKGGNGYLRSRINNFCEMAARQPVLLITDLDQFRCPSRLMHDWFGRRAKPDELIFRVAVHEIESWLLADHEAFRSLLGRRSSKLPPSPDLLPDPKNVLLDLARRAIRDVRDDLVAENGAIARQGLGYNSRLSAWIEDAWEPARAAQRSPSLAKARLRLHELANGI